MSDTRSMTITEALAELRTIDKRIEAKRQFVETYLLRPERMKDPLEKDGGSVEAIRREMQAIGDLSEEKIRIRRAIQAANQATRVVVEGVERTIADWLVWRRDVAQDHRSFLARLARLIETNRSEAIKKGFRLTEQEASAVGEIIVNVSERDLAETTERAEAVMGRLDGQLSLANATIVISW